MKNVLINDGPAILPRIESFVPSIIYNDVVQEYLCLGNDLKPEVILCTAFYDAQTLNRPDGFTEGYARIGIDARDFDNKLMDIRLIEDSNYSICHAANIAVADTTPITFNNVTSISDVCSDSSEYVLKLAVNLPSGSTQFVVDSSSDYKNLLPVGTTVYFKEDSHTTYNVISLGDNGTVVVDKAIASNYQAGDNISKIVHTSLVKDGVAHVEGYKYRHRTNIKGSIGSTTFNFYYQWQGPQVAYNTIESLLQLYSLECGYIVSGSFSDTTGSYIASAMDINLEGFTVYGVAPYNSGATSSFSTSTPATQSITVTDKVEGL
jgi:hypothetical protein